MLHDKGSHLDYDHILNISEGIAQGMAFLHGSRPPMLHRDLKSLNVLVLPLILSVVDFHHI